MKARALKVRHKFRYFNFITWSVELQGLQLARFEFWEPERESRKNAIFKKAHSGGGLVTFIKSHNLALKHPITFAGMHWFFFNLPPSFKKFVSFSIETSQHFRADTVAKFFHQLKKTSGLSFGILQNDFRASIEVRAAAAADADAAGWVTDG